MPELPEVETIRRQLATVLKRKTIKKVEIRLAKMIKGPSVLFKKNIKKARVTAVRRRAKIIILELSNGFTIFIHLKMTGQLVYKKKKIIRSGGHPINGGVEDLPNKFSHIFFTFTDGSRLFFNDIRQFGYLRLIRTEKVNDFFQELKLGPEPLDNKFSLTVFKDLLSKRKKTKIKQLLLDQTFIAGLGNIYATEVCFMTGLKPTRPAGRLKQAEINKLFKAIKKILLTAIKKQGTSSNTYMDAYGQPGRYVPLLKVYGRQGEKCYRCCKAVIKSVLLGGRGTAFCPKCQV